MNCDACDTCQAPLPGFECAPLNNARCGFFEPSQFEAVLNHLPPYLKVPLRMGGLTWWRVQIQILALEWPQIDLCYKVIRLDAGQSKNKAPRVLLYWKFPDLVKVIDEQRVEVDLIQWQRHTIALCAVFRESKQGVQRIAQGSAAGRNSRNFQHETEQTHHPFSVSQIRFCR